MEDEQMEFEFYYGQQTFPFYRSVKDQAEDSMRGHFAPEKGGQEDRPPPPGTPENLDWEIWGYW